ncbi:MAG: hypothetical protein IJP11_04735 [Oscillospiraceae bacterium]|nr:hypothetical protein [Oscillospiraceae bacterium]
MNIRLIALLLALSLLCGCSGGLVPNEYTVISEHSDTNVESRSDAVSAESYEELKYAILSFVEQGITHGVIRSYRYDGDVTEDLSTAAYEVWKNDPLGAYRVEYITTDCNLLLSYYESHVEITYRPDAVSAEEIGYVRGRGGAEEAIAAALEDDAERLTLRISAYGSAMDCAQLAADYCAANPETVMEAPQVTASVYPEEGSIRIVDLKFDYTHSAAERTNMQLLVSSVLTSASNYVRFRNEDNAKAQMLVAYLLGRFEYVEGSSLTPVYSLLCEGICSSRTFAEVFQILCDRVGLSCRTVSGYLDGESYSWNILQIGETYHHVDLMRYVREGLSDLVYYADSDMDRYSWDRETYPACGLPESTLENPAAPQDPPAEGEDPEAPPAEPEQPPEEQPVQPEPPAEGEDPESPAPDPEAPDGETGVQSEPEPGS